MTAAETALLQPHVQRPQRAMEAVAAALLARAETWEGGALVEGALTIRGPGWVAQLRRVYTHRGDAGAVLRFADAHGIRAGAVGLWNGHGYATQLRDAWRAREDSEGVAEVQADIAAMLATIGVQAPAALPEIHEKPKSYRKPKEASAA
jgi:hypothetical protein